VSGRRDFGEQFSAKLEKHLERLPDYAQRAQETLQRYLPPTDGQRPNPLVRPSARPPKVTDVPLVAEVRSKWARWNEPAAKLERRKRRASRAVTLWVILTLLCVLVGVAGMLSQGLGMAAATGAAGVIVFGTLGVRSGMRLRQLNRIPVPISAMAASSPPEPLPPADSAAHEPMRRLAECEESLTELLRQLSPSDALPDTSVDDARVAAQEAATTLRGLAARIQAVERARNAAPPGERAALDAAVSTLREQLDDGLEGYGALVAAAGRAVAASASGTRQSRDALTDATDRLAGLAIALRELS
jgi:hypothetical protein